MDLTKNAPRSVGQTMLGIVQLARVIDKAKALTHGNVGEYKYDCPMDRGLFEYLGIDPRAFLDVVRNAKSDAEIETYAKTFVAMRDARSMEAFNKKWLFCAPAGESLRQFEDLRAQIAPSRTDVVAWADLLDLEEGRTVPNRAVVRA
jgi:hypothetical protein